MENKKEKKVYLFIEIVYPIKHRFVRFNKKKYKSKKSLLDFRALLTRFPKQLNRFPKQLFNNLFGPDE